MGEWFDFFTQNQDAIIDRMITQMQQAIPAYASLPRVEVGARLKAALPPFAQDLDEATPRHFNAYWEELSYQRAQQGLPLASLLGVLMIGTQSMIDSLKQAQPDDAALHLALVEKAYAISAKGIAGVYSGYDRVNQELIAAQQSTLAEISTPIVPIYQGILVLPIVGAIHADRAGQIMEGLLDGISIHSADVVIMDITGVPVIDTGIAHYLLQSARAARLLGSQVILVGISAEIAQTIVQLGIDLTGITTRANLQDGIAYALALQGMGILPLADR